jgi:hypothetical protein
MDLVHNRTWGGRRFKVLVVIGAPQPLSPSEG